MARGGGMMRLTVREAKANFFRSERAVSFAERVAFRINRRVGGAVRLTARRSMRKARRVASVAELTPLQQEQYNAARRAWHRGGHRWPEPKLPYKPSDPGQPPRVRSGELRKLLYFAQSVESGSPTVVVGPVRFETGNPNAGEVPRIHEYGGIGSDGAGRALVSFPERPYMRPALEKILPQVPRYTKQAIREARA